jgi:hypothetical protein
MEQKLTDNTKQALLEKRDEAILQENVEALASYINTALLVKDHDRRASLLDQFLNAQGSLVLNPVATLYAAMRADKAPGQAVFSKALCFFIHEGVNLEFTLPEGVDGDSDPTFSFQLLRIALLPQEKRN